MALSKIEANSVQTDVLMGRNRIINGDMRIDQRNAGAAVTLSGAEARFPVDRTNGYNDTDATVTAQQVTDTPAGFVNSAKLIVTAEDASIGSTQRCTFRQRVEGLNTSDLGWGTANAKTVTLSFWVKSSVTGTHGGAFMNSGADYSYPFTYVISLANTWEYKTVTVSGPTSGTWLTTNGIGIQVIFAPAMGSTYSGTAGAWAATRYEGAAGAVNVLGTLNATWQITGVQLEAGSVATSFERRPYGQELQLAQRYYWQTFSSSATLAINLGTVGTGATKGEYVFIHPVQMRAAPSVSVTSISNFAIYVYGASVAKTGTLLAPAYATNRSVLVRIDYSGATGTVGTAVNLDANNNDSLKFSAEL